MNEQVEVYTSAWSVTHAEENFHDPNDFIPSRWTNSDCQDNKDASQPFSLGPRGCLGRKYVYLHTLFEVHSTDWSPIKSSFAQIEISLILAKIFHKYSLELVDDGLDWEQRSHLYVMWWKPELRVRIRWMWLPFLNARSLLRRTGSDDDRAGFEVVKILRRCRISKSELLISSYLIPTSCSRVRPNV